MNSPEKSENLMAGAAAATASTLLLPDESPTFSWLVALTPPLRGKLYAIKRSGATIGRAPDNDIVLDVQEQVYILLPACQKWLFLKSLA